MREGEYGAVLGDQIEGGMKVAASLLFFRGWYPRIAPSPLGEGAPQGRIGYRRYERQMRKAEQRGICVGSASP